MAESDQRFRPSERIRRSADFERAMRRGVARRDRFLRVHVIRNGLAWSRLGLVVSRRVGNAVVRHAVRRRIREAFRLSKSALPRGVDVVCVAHPPAAERDADIRASLTVLVRSAAPRG